MNYLTEKISKIILNFSLSDNICEIRIRLNKPLCIKTVTGEFFLNEEGGCIPEKAYLPTKADIKTIVQYISEYSLYAFNDEVKKGYITLRNGFRIGITGQAVYDGENIITMKNIFSLNIRIAREIKNCGTEIYNKLLSDKLKNILIISPPGCGKTTLLRDLARQISNGGATVGIADERGEIAGCFMGEPQLDVGIMTDVIDGCRKEDGINMLLRSMSPDVIVLDEIGTTKDKLAIEEALKCGTKVICTAHGGDMNDITKRSVFKQIFEDRLFDYYVFLCGKGKIKEITEG
jgi:stage III sporulation protein AA